MFMQLHVMHQISDYNQSSKRTGAFDAGEESVFTPEADFSASLLFSGLTLSTFVSGLTPVSSLPASYNH